jgi:opacity protein-like surface antigen
MKTISRSIMLLALVLIASAAGAQDVITTSDSMWRGFYLGGNLGGAWNSTCNTWSPNGGNGVSNPTLATAFYNRDCPNNGAFIGGIQLGYNFQSGPLVWGFGLDYEFLGGKDRHRAFTYSGASPPPDGTYTFSSHGSPNGFGLLGPRIAYAVDDWLPFFRIGSVFASGSRRSTATFTDASGTATFTGGKDFHASGLGIGVGVEYMLGAPWSFKAEYTHISLGKGDNDVTTCTGTTATCTAFGNVSLDNSHNSFTANIFRVGLNYKF